MKLKCLAFAALVATGSLAHAENDSASYDLDPTLVNQSVEFNAFKNSAGSFMDTFTFTFTSAPNVNVGAAAAIHVQISPKTPDITFTDVFLNGLQGTVTNSGNVSMFWVGDVAGDPSNAPAYTLTVYGTAQKNATYGGSLNVALVPEPETYAMMLAGLLAVGFVARRRVG